MNVIKLPDGNYYKQYTAPDLLEQSCFERLRSPHPRLKMPHYHHADSDDCARCAADSYAYYDTTYIYSCDRCEKNDDRDDPFHLDRRLQSRCHSRTF